MNKAKYEVKKLSSPIKLKLQVTILNSNQLIYDSKKEIN